MRQTASAVVAATLLLAGPASAVTVAEFDDFSDTPGDTIIQLDPGTNLITGLLPYDPDTQTIDVDAFRAVIDPGETITSILVQTSFVSFTQRSLALSGPQNIVVSGPSCGEIDCPEQFETWSVRIDVAAIPLPTAALPFAAMLVGAAAVGARRRSRRAR